MSAATFRRSGKIEQARGAIQEAEVRDEENPNLWVQVSKKRLLSSRPRTSYIQHFFENDSWDCTTPR
jgi:hypothetical protein